jgi:hypothetical protein
LWTAMPEKSLAASPEILYKCKLGLLTLELF